MLGDQDSRDLVRRIVSQVMEWTGDLQATITNLSMYCVAMLYQEWQASHQLCLIWCDPIKITHIQIHLDINTAIMNPEHLICEHV